MKKSLLVLFFGFISFNIFCQDLDCQVYKNGLFMIPMDSLAPETLIMREGNRQEELIYGELDTLKFEVSWEGDCTYILTPIDKDLLFNSGMPKDAKLIVQITKTSGDNYWQTAKFNFDEYVMSSQVFRADSTILLKYKKIEADIKAQIQVSDLMQTYMKEQEYDKAVSLFSKPIQKIIKEKMKDRHLFDNWCKSWILSESDNIVYMKKIKKGQANFILEDGVWKINEL